MGIGPKQMRWRTELGRPVAGVSATPPATSPAQLADPLSPLQALGQTRQHPPEVTIICSGLGLLGAKDTIYKPIGIIFA